MIQLTDISIYLSINGRALVSGLSFTLNPGDRTVIIGEEGNGKSTLLALIADPALISDHAEYTGSISRGGHRIGYLPQELSPAERALRNTPRQSSGSIPPSCTRNAPYPRSPAAKG